MKTKNVRVREKDIKQGITIHVAHPFYGIESMFVTSRPYKSKVTGSLKFDCIGEYGDKEYFIEDAGINSGNSYNDRKTFFKIKHAEEWVNMSSKDPCVILRHKRHEDMCRDMDMFDDIF